MISILLDFVPDEVHKEITMKYATVGSNAIDLRTAMLEVERIIEREKDSALQEEVAEDIYVWNDEANNGHGGFVLAAKSETRRRTCRRGSAGEKCKGQG